MVFMKKLFFLGIASLTLITCQQNQPVELVVDDTTLDSIVETITSQQAVFEPPFEGIDIPFKTYNYNSKKGLQFSLESGTVVDIPANAFEDSEGNPITENIEVKYREFHSISDIILSGAKMKYNQVDTVDANFESAGMFEIRAYGKEKELNLRKDKTIKVDLASYKDGDFKNYRMNEESTNWEFIDQKKPKKNTNKTKKIKEIADQITVLESVCLIEPTEYKKGMEVFDLDYDLGRFPELGFVSDAMWICVGSDDEKRQLRQTLTGFDDLSLEAKDSCNVFELSVWKKNGTESILNKKTFQVMPVWSGKSLTRAKKEYRGKLDNLKKLQDERQVHEREADLWRSFELKGMGVYNSDLVMDFLKFITVSLVVACKEKIKSFFYITNNGTMAIKYYEQDFENFKLNANSTNSIIAILPGNRVGKVSEQDFKLAIDRLEKDPTSKKLELQVDVQDLPVVDQKSFENHIARY